MTDTWLGRFRAEPLAWPYRPALSRLAGDDPEVSAIEHALGELAGVRFVASVVPPRRRRRGQRPSRDVTAYDRTIVEERAVPTREHNDHDLANALAWAAFPRSKAALHARQLVAVRTAHARAEEGTWARTPEGDALAMLDEGGIAFVVRAELVDDVAGELRAGDDGAVGRRAARGEALGIVYGHGLLEHLGRRRDDAWRPMAGLAVPLPFPGDPREVALGEVDRALASRISDPAAFRARDGHGIASATPSVLGLGQ